MMIMFLFVLAATVFLTYGDTCDHRIAATDYVDSILSHEGQLTGGSYLNDYSQCWNIQTGNARNFVTLVFIIFQVEQANTSGICSNDVLKIYNGSFADESKLMGVYCGHRNETLIDTRSTNILVTFTTNHMVTDKGFFIQFYSYVGAAAVQEAFKYTPLSITGLIIIAVLLISITVITILTCILKSHDRNKNNQVWAQSDNNINVTKNTETGGVTPKSLTSIMLLKDTVYVIDAPAEYPHSVIMVPPTVYKKPESEINQVRERSSSCSLSSSSSSSSSSDSSRRNNSFEEVGNGNIVELDTDSLKDDDDIDLVSVERLSDDWEDTARLSIDE